MGYTKTGWYAKRNSNCQLLSSCWMRTNRWANCRSPSNNTGSRFYAGTVNDQRHRLVTSNQFQPLFYRHFHLPWCYLSLKDNSVSSPMMSWHSRCPGTGVIRWTVKRERETASTVKKMGLHMTWVCQLQELTEDIYNCMLLVAGFISNTFL